MAFGTDLSEMLSYPNGTLSFAVCDRVSATILTNGRSYHQWESRRFEMLPASASPLRIRCVAMSATVLAAGAAPPDHDDSGSSSSSSNSSTNTAAVTGTLFAVRLDAPAGGAAQAIPAPSDVASGKTAGFGAVIAAGCLSERVAASLPDAGVVVVYGAPTAGADLRLSAVIRAPASMPLELRFGTHLAMTDSLLVVGMPSSTHSTSGMVYLYRWSAAAANWTLDSVLAGPSPGFGSVVDVDCAGTTLAVACPCHKDEGGACVQRVFTYRSTGQAGAEWKLADELQDPHPELRTHFGAALALDTRTSMAVGAPGVAGTGTEGRVYVFDRTKLLATVLQPAGDSSFGSSITLHDDVLVAGSPGQQVRSMPAAGVLLMFSVRELSAVTLAIILSVTLVVVVASVLAVLACYKLHPSSVIALSKAANI
jgi:hypothetical protein